MPINPNMVAIQTLTVGAGGASVIDFQNIPQTYTDLYVVSSVRSTSTTWDGFYLYFNNTNSNLSSRYLLGDGSGPGTGTINSGYAGTQGKGDSLAGTFASSTLYIPNYTSSDFKSYSVDNAAENTATLAYVNIINGLWSSTSAINRVTLYPGSGSFVQHSSATLYGVTRSAVGAKATGGAIYEDNTYFYHVFPSSGTFTPTQSISADILVVAGGGGGTSAFGGGGGAGGLLAFTGQSLTAQAYSVTVGGGGAGGANNNNAVAGSAGGDSQFGSLTLVKGGGGAQAYEADTAGSAANGGSGAGATYRESSKTNRNPFGTATSGQGNNGGSNNFASFTYASGGGGGAGAVGGSGAANSQGANGGDGTTAYSSWGIATGTGEKVGNTYYYAGGGAGGGGGASSPNNSRGGYGGGGNSVAGSSSSTLAIAGTANTGGGGGGGSYSGGSGAGGASGGSGIVIVRYAK